MSFELKFERNKPEPLKQLVDPIQEELRRVGVYVIRGNRFDTRQARIHDSIGIHMEEVSIEGLSETKKWLMKQTDITKQELFDTTLPYGTAMDTVEYRAPVDAVIDILTHVKDIALSDASDENCYILCIDLLAQAYKLMGKTWKESHVVGDTPLVVHQTVTPGVQPLKPGMTPTGQLSGGQQPGGQAQPDMAPVETVVSSRPQQ